MDFTNNELKVLQILWNSQQPMTCKDILSKNNDDSWAEQTIYNLIKSLIGKDAVRISGYTRCGKTWGRLFETKYSLPDFIDGLLAPVSDVLDYQKFTKKIIEISEIDIKMISEIITVIDQLHNKDECNICETDKNYTIK